ncbi:MAG: ATP-binding cassette domain-containing protein [Desulfobacterales bacterium]|jgi:simple sugar transport system ATP-binding protein
MQIELQDIHKYYGPVKANDGVDLKVMSGEIHGILGENGAGKSTLMKILAGFSLPTRGTIRADGEMVDYRNPAQAADLGIGMLYQDPLDFPLLTVLDNFMLGQTEGLNPKQKSFRLRFADLSEALHFDLKPDAALNSLTIGERQQLEIIRLMSLGIQVLILDEPTTGISSTQKEILFNALKKLATEGKSIILVSHKLEDVEALCDCVTVLRQGKVTGGMDRPFDSRGLLEMMFGTPPVFPPRCSETPGKEVLVMKQVYGSGGRAGLQDCDAVIREGEVVGLAGLEGSGQGVFLRIAGGLKPARRGSVSLLGSKMHGKNHHAFKHQGVSFLPASRLEEGLIAGLRITEHFALQADQQHFVVRWPEALQQAHQQIEKFQIKGRPDSTVEELSGGNQQRLLLSFLPADPQLLLLENPTRGLDIESVNWVWQHLHTYCTRRTSIVFSSPELDEILMVADRVLVFFNGRIIKEVDAAQTNAQELGKAIAGKV